MEAPALLGGLHPDRRRQGHLIVLSGSSNPSVLILAAAMGADVEEQEEQEEQEDASGEVERYHESSSSAVRRVVLYGSACRVGIFVAWLLVIAPRAVWGWGRHVGRGSTPSAVPLLRQQPCMRAPWRRALPFWALLMSNSPEWTAS